MLVEIEKVIVNDRIRKDFGNIDELAQDIKDNGLINPPVVTPEFELIAGERRYRAMKSLGWQQIEVRVMSVQDALHKLKLEISENENRKEFSFAERMEWSRLLEKEYKRKAISNQGSRNDLTSDKILEKVDTNKSVSEDVGFKNKETYRQAKYIYENAGEEMIKQLDDGKLSINGAYVSLKNKAKQLEEENNRLQREKANIQSELQREKSKEPIVKTQVVDNTDYTIVEKAKQLEKKIAQKDVEYNRLHGEYSKKAKEVVDIQKQMESLRQSKEEKQYVEELEQNSLLFCAKVEKFIKEVGGLAYLSNHINELSKPNQQAYLKCVELINAWGQNVLSNTHQYL